MKAIEQFKTGLAHNRAGRGAVAVSVCSAHPDVLRAVFRTADKYQTFALIESTSNQVDQYGGYTGLTPSDFVGLVHQIAAEEGFPPDSILLGGDHLGTNSWCSMPAQHALDEACKLVAAYIDAGYKKIHLDASFICRDDVAPLSDEIVATRCAEMAKVCEAHCGDNLPFYVIGTEVPTPGGVFDDEEMHITTPAQVETTLEVFEAVFRRNNLEAAWDRVVGLVVQPGVEFGDDVIHEFQPEPLLSSTILNHSNMVYEAHSTDYQTAEALKEMMRHHFYILKVGPWLTFALREGLYLLELIEKELSPPVPSCFRETLLKVMNNDPRHWKRYYVGSPEEINFKLNFSYSDRARYYLGCDEVVAAQKQLMKNLEQHLPESLISQFLPNQYTRLRAGRLAKDPRSLAVDRVTNVLELYMDAGCGELTKSLD
jgi:D-tagatose-1,6-bisphosphate aldolase subunit GatZ/KbaZ